METPATPPTPAAPVTPPLVAEPPTIVYDDFARVQLRVATVLKAEAVERSKKLLRLQIDLGDHQRQILAGIKEHYTPEEMVGRQIVVVANLAPREVIKGEVSNGMLLAATDATTGKVVVLSPGIPVAAGSGVR